MIKLFRQVIPVIFMSFILALNGAAATQGFMQGGKPPEKPKEQPKDKPKDKDRDNPPRDKDKKKP